MGFWPIGSGSDGSELCNCIVRDYMKDFWSLGLEKPDRGHCYRSVTKTNIGAFAILGGKAQVLSAYISVYIANK